MEHKAFLFDYSTFDQELRVILENALASGDCSVLTSFINRQLDSLRDPYEGDRLDSEWQSLIETKDAHQYGDFALTKYYDPLTDIGLGMSWEFVQQYITKDRTLSASPILGETIGPETNTFDPGKMGSYFQSAQQVQEHLKHFLQDHRAIHSQQLRDALEMLTQAVNENKGLYVTF